LWSLPLCVTAGKAVRGCKALNHSMINYWVGHSIPSI
jgi:hypothetical protein